LQRDLHSDPSLEGLTWAEKLAVLRSVNKPPDRPKVKQQRLKYIRDVGDHEMFVWSSEKDELYEKRRIRHLVEQARMKGGKKMDWVYEAEVRARGIDWTTGRLRSAVSSAKTLISDSGVRVRARVEDCTESVDSYDVCISEPPQLFSSHKINRTNSYMAP